MGTWIESVPYCCVKIIYIFIMLKRFINSLGEELGRKRKPVWSRESCSFPGSSVDKDSACNAEDAGDEGSIPGSERSLGGGNGNPLQYSYLQNPVDSGAWWPTVHGVAKGQTQLKRLSPAQSSLARGIPSSFSLPNFCIKNMVKIKSKNKIKKLSCN